MNVDHNLRFIVASWQGEIDIPSIVRHCDLRTKQGAHEYLQIIDATNARIAGLSSDSKALAIAAMYLADNCLKHGRSGRTAIVVSTPMDFGMCRTIASYFEPAGEVSVFYRRNEALAWLGLSSATAGAAIAMATLLISVLAWGGLGPMAHSFA